MGDVVRGVGRVKGKGSDLPGRHSHCHFSSLEMRFQSWKTFKDIIPYFTDEKAER